MSRRRPSPRLDSPRHDRGGRCPRGGQPPPPPPRQVPLVVYAAAVPFAQLSIPGEQATGSDGFAELSFRTLAGFPASAHQQLLAIFVRARKSGEDLLLSRAASSVSYRRSAIIDALQRHDAYWAVPIPRSYERPIRSLVRERHDGYTAP